jgi:hypothetical protein
MRRAPWAPRSPRLAWLLWVRRALQIALPSHRAGWEPSRRGGQDAGPEGAYLLPTVARTGFRLGLVNGRVLEAWRIFAAPGGGRSPPRLRINDAPKLRGCN